MTTAMETRLFINNEFVDALSGRKFAVVNPATEEEIAQVHEADVGDVNRAVAAAEEALPSWKAMAGFDRALLFYKLADLLEQYNSDLAKIEAVSMGRPVSTYTEGLGAARFMRYVAGKATDIRGETSTHTAGFLNLTLRQPFGVCAAITPWNAPITMLCFKIGGALIAGNTLVAKSSEKAPLTSLLLGSFIKQAGFPPGVVNILSGLGPVCGHALASHMHIRKLSFTGSLGAGRAIKRAAANSNMKNITLELGGKSPLIIFDDADLQKAAEESARSVLLNSGQACIASSRVYVHHAVVEEFNQHLVQAIQELGANPDIWSDPLDSGTRRGPQANEKQFKYIMGHLQEAKDNGAKFLTGGDKEGDRGFFIAPTVVTGVAESSRIMREEVFGPVVCVSSFSKEDEVVKKANDSPYGLYASVYTRDLDRAIRIATAFESGTVGVNCTSPMMTHDMPFGGFKESGEGKELGIHGVNQWTELKSIYIAVSAS